MPNWRNPNGYGSVVKLSGNRRKPFAVRKTVGYDDRAYPIYEIIGYYQTRKDALTALSEYNHDPYDINLSKITMSELYDLWSAEAYPKMKQSLKNCYAAAYKHCSAVYDLQYKTLRKNHMQSCIDSCNRGYSTRSNIKLLFSQLDKYAYDHDIISKSYSKNLETGERAVSDKHSVFTDAEVMRLWEMREKPFVDETLFMLYTGFRVSEMLRILTVNVFLDDNYIIGGIKTASGTNRTVPIHPDLLPVITDYYSESNTYLFQKINDQSTYAYSNWFIKHWAEAMCSYGLTHLTHDCRHTFRSKLDSAGANKVAIDRLMGHSSGGIGEKIYTHKSIKELQNEINKLTYGAVHFSPLVTHK